MKKIIYLLTFLGIALIILGVMVDLKKIIEKEEHSYEVISRKGC